MSEMLSDAGVFFGATGDLAYKKILPSLQAMVKRGHLNAPIIVSPRRTGAWTSSKVVRGTARRNMAGSTTPADLVEDQAHDTR